MNYSSEEIKKLVEIAKLEDVISKFISLKKNGNKYLALCPFHKENTPSFYVSPDIGIYKCFGCGETGDVIDFLQKHKFFSFPDAVEFIADIYGIKLKKVSHEKKVIDNTSKEIYDAINCAKDFFQSELSNSKNLEAKNYLLNRGISSEEIEKFEIGYSPNQKDILVKVLEKNFTTDTLKKTGLFIEKSNSIYERFRGRVVFPIHDAVGKVIAFGGRILSDDKNFAKYINSPESTFFEKRKNLYGIFQAKREIRKNNKCFLLEGYTDVIAMSASGLKNSVASMGTSLTLEQIKIIKRYTKNICMIFDGDTAGIKSSLKNLTPLLEEGFYPKIVPMPVGKDPHNLFISNGKNFLKDYIKKNEIDFVIFKTKFLLSEIQDDIFMKTEAIKDLSSDLSLIKDEIYKNVLAKKCSEIFDVSINLFLKKKIIKKKIIKKKTENISQEKKKKILDNSILNLEKEFFRFLFNKKHENQKLILSCKNNLEDYAFSCEENEKIWKIILDLSNNNLHITINNFYEHHFSDDKTSNLISDLFLEKKLLSKNWTHQENFEEDEICDEKDILVIIYKMKLAVLEKLKSEIIKNLTSSDDLSKNLAIYENLLEREKFLLEKLEKMPV